jgi:hypothetical protein
MTVAKNVNAKTARREELPVGLENISSLIVSRRI